MKKLLITMSATLVCVGAFGQGWVGFQNDINNLIYFTTDTTKLLAGDVAKTADNGGGAGAFPLAGSGLYTGNGGNSTAGSIASLATPTTFIASLWAGTSSSSLSLMTTAPIADYTLEGQLVGANVVLPTGMPAGTPVWFQVQVYNAAYGSAGAAWAAGQYAGESSIFQATPEAASYAPLPQTTAPVNSTWAPGTFAVVDMVQYQSGFLGGIPVQDVPYGAVPEPGTFALAGMGLAALLVFRRRK
jgi:hypothetical protein